MSLYSLVFLSSLGPQATRQTLDQWPKIYAWCDPLSTITFIPFSTLSFTCKCKAYKIMYMSLALWIHHLIQLSPKNSFTNCARARPSGPLVIYSSLYSPQLSTAKRMNFATSKKDSVIYWHAHLLFPRQGLAASCMMRLMSEIHQSYHITFLEMSNCR